MILRSVVLATLLALAAPLLAAEEDENDPLEGNVKFGYRHADIQFEADVEGAPETMEILLSGPFVGLLVRF